MTESRLSTIVYRRPDVVLLRSRRGWMYPRPLDQIESIDGEPLP